MAEKETPWLTYALLGGAAYLAYWMWQKSQAAQQTTSPQAVQFDPLNGLPPTGGVTTPGLAVQPVPSQTLPVITNSPAIPSGISQTVYSTVMSWAQTDGRGPVLAMAAAAVPMEFAGMYDLITNYWDKNVPPGVPQVQFWNNLRAKYDPGPPPDQTW